MSEPKAESSNKRKRGMLQRPKDRDLQRIMYGYGDDLNPLPETVALVEDIVVEYVTDLVHKAQDVASNKEVLRTEDLFFLFRKDSPKVNRCKQVLAMIKEVKQATKVMPMLD